MENSYGQVPMKVFEAAIKNIEKNARKQGRTEEEIDEIPISFEYLIGSFFPEIVKNVEREANIQHTKGYIEGYNAAKEELKGIK